jgi:hypothetical protein
MLTPNVVRALVPAVNASLQRTGLALYPIEEFKSPNSLGQPIGSSTITTVREQ